MQPKGGIKIMITRLINSKLAVLIFGILLTAAFVVRFTGAEKQLHIERMTNRQLAESLPDSVTWKLVQMKPDVNASPSRMGVTYIFQSPNGDVRNLVVEVINPNKVWYDKLNIGDKVSFLPTIAVGENSPDSKLAVYIRPQKN